jgi:hypothetical protein
MHAQLGALLDTAAKVEAHSLLWEWGVTGAAAVKEATPNTLHTQSTDSNMTTSTQGK